MALIYPKRVSANLAPHCAATARRDDPFRRFLQESSKWTDFGGDPCQIQRGEPCLWYRLRETNDNSRRWWIIRPRRLSAPLFLSV